ncbi:PTS mannnose family transporter subunit IIA [Enterococcus sp. JM4C]|uniref:dihydroxyacetone kinase phosphoryl donor subunit DhaM n=1 Tax=Candidatus Enterococcus huntleyi TaxID=1857217 RepID=UPI00137A764D|nr:dihydroxyacetone kinase phosphoryl donor subunit DhaM [Enterococcus sp. JM4C]KAF1295576.1 PTS mannnose family transporter subunit IIA [Enterococcus sp. JM4C]
MSSAILLVSHVEEIAKGLQRLLAEVAKDVTVVVAAGLEDGDVGTSMERISAGIDGISEDNVLAFYDLGSAKMNLEMAMEMTDKEIHLYDTAFIESAYTAAALLQAGAERSMIDEQLAELKIK